MNSNVCVAKLPAGKGVKNRKTDYKVQMKFLASC